MSTRVRIEEELIGIEAVARFRFVWPMYPIAVDCSGRHPGQVSVPDLIRIFRQFNSLNFPLRRIEQAHLNLGGVGREQCKIGSLPIPRGATRKRVPLFHLYLLG